jgi:hypothetical protein
VGKSRKVMGGAMHRVTLQLLRLVLAFATATSVSSSLAEPLRRIFTPDQVATFAANATRPSAGLVTDTASLIRPKSLATGVYINGSFTYSYSGNSVTITVEQINNDSYTYTTGTLRLELWAAEGPTAPTRDSVVTGYKLATTSSLDPLTPRTYYSNVTRTTTFTTPPPGTYWIVLLLSEYTPATCTASDGFCFDDTGVFPNQQTFGSPPLSGNVTVASQSGQQCYENFPLAGYNLLQQETPGLFQDYPSSVSCSSLGMPYYAGLFSANTSVSVYTTSATVAELLCSAGLLTACTTPPPTTQSYTDLWWNPLESGWGVTITHHPSGDAFIAWYTYDSSGNSKWYVAPNCLVVNSACSGTLYQTSGPPLGTIFNPALVTVQTVGSISFVFSGPTTGIMTYTVNGISGAELITRQQF